MRNNFKPAKSGPPDICALCVHFGVTYTTLGLVRPLACQDCVCEGWGLASWYHSLKRLYADHVQVGDDR